MSDRPDRAVATAAGCGFAALLIKLLDSLFHRPAVTISGARGLLKVTPASASANIEKLVSAGILREVTGRVRDRIYVAPDILRFTSPESTPAPATEATH